MAVSRPQPGIIAEPTIHGLTLLLQVTGPDHGEVRARLAQLPKIARGLQDRFSESQLSVVVAVGSGYWNTLWPEQRPAELGSLRELGAAAVSLPETPADLALVIRSDRLDANYFAGQALLKWFGGIVELAYELTSFRYLDGRNLFGFPADQRALPGQRRRELALVSPAQDPQLAGGSYLWLQYFSLDISGWQRLDPSAQQELMGVDKVRGTPVPTDFTSHREQLAEVNEQVWRLHMPVADMEHSGAVELLWSQSRQPLTSWLQARWGEAGDQPMDPLLRFQQSVLQALFFAPPIPWLQQLGEPS